MKTKKIIAIMMLSSLITLAIPFVSAVKPAGLPRGTLVVYVTSQDKYYDTIVPIDPDNGKQLPWKGPFQLLEKGVGPTGLQTEFGPSDPEYVGGRWWVDANPNGIQDENDVYFLCPLLGPGRDAP
jgi:hypothetical protein